MRFKLLLILALIAALGAASCKNKAKSKLPDKNDKVTAFATIPSYKVMFLALDKLEAADTANLDRKAVLPAAEDTLHLAFSWGVLSANAQLAVNGRDAAWLQAITGQLIELAPALGLQDIAAKLDADVQPLTSKGDWDLLESTFYNLQYTVEQDLWRLERYAEYTMMALGAWARSTNQIARMVSLDYSTDSATLLMQRDAWQYLAENLGLISAPSYVASAPFKQALAQVREMRALMDQPLRGTFNEEQLSRVIAVTELLWEAFYTPQSKETP